VVLARELSKEEITAIRSSTSLELEVFVHGAHCMSVSGQCYLSAMLGGKSGNRGRCAQPCRLPFSAGCPGISKDGEAVLSLKDLCLVSRLPELAAMGIESFKIEGRMKRPEYVAAAVSACRAALKGEEPDLNALRAVFSRSGFTSAYFDGRITPDMFGYRRKEDVEAASGVLKELQGTFQKESPRFPASMELTLKPDVPAFLILEADGKTVSVSGELPRGSEHPADEASARKFLGKLGGTPYFLANLSVKNEGNLSLPASGFNALRRGAAGRSTHPDPGTVSSFSPPHPAKRKKFRLCRGALGRIPQLFPAAPCRSLRTFPDPPPRPGAGSPHGRAFFPSPEVECRPPPFHL